jgi:hypothetical protein
VYVRLPEEEGTRFWTFQPGETAYLAMDDVRLTASAAYIWAESDSAQWNQFKDELFQVVAEPYLSATIGTHTHTFNP